MNDDNFDPWRFISVRGLDSVVFLAAAVVVAIRAAIFFVFLK